MKFERDKPNNDQSFLIRLTVLNFIWIFFLLLLIIRVFQLTIISGNKYFELSEHNFLTKNEINSPRGIICDRNSVPLANNRLSFSLFCTPSNIETEKIINSLSILEPILNQDFSKIKDNMKALTKFQKRSLIKIASNINFDIGISLYEKLYELEGFYLMPEYNRFYTYGEQACHITGYIGRIQTLTPEQKDDMESKGYNIDEDRIGLTNTEKLWEDKLRGVKGNELILRDSRGRERQKYIENQAVQGDKIFLTIDIKLQQYVSDLLKDRVGAVVAMNPKDGSILAIASSPGYDPNNVAQSLNTSPVSFVNKAVSGAYPPASTIKPIVAAIALDNGISTNQKYYCEGEYFLPNYNLPYKCDNEYGHGWLKMSDAVKVSCNIYFYQLAAQIGKKKMLEYLDKWGLGKTTGVDLTREKSGRIISEYRGELIMLGIGQGRFSLTPIQIANAYSAIANGGTLYTPHILDRIESESGELVYKYEHLVVNEAPASKETLDTVRKMMSRVVNEQGGTAFRGGFKPEWKAAGKTGTAETSKEGILHSWFSCLAPYDDPEIVTVVLVEEGGHGSEIAVPITKNILQYYFENIKNADKKEVKPEQQTSSDIRSLFSDK